MESIIGHKIDYNGGGGSERPAAPIQQKLTQVPTPRSKKAPYLPHSGLFTKDDNSSSPPFVFSQVPFMLVLLALRPLKAHVSSQPHTKGLSARSL